MNISLVVARSENNAIGQAGGLPWHLPNDLKHFKQTTLGKPIIMGRTTFESIGRPLPGRSNIILTQNIDYDVPGCVVLHSKQAVLNHCQHEDEVMIVGGAKIYQLFLPEVTKLYVTIVHAHIQGDAFFPSLIEEEWQEITREKHLKDEKHLFDYSFVTFIRRI